MSTEVVRVGKSKIVQGSQTVELDNLRGSTWKIQLAVLNGSLCHHGKGERVCSLGGKEMGVSYGLGV